MRGRPRKVLNLIFITSNTQDERRIRDRRACASPGTAMDVNSRRAGVVKLCRNSMFSWSTREMSFGSTMGSDRDLKASLASFLDIRTYRSQCTRPGALRKISSLEVGGRILRSVTECGTACYKKGKCLRHWKTLSPNRPVHVICADSRFGNV